MGLLYGKMKEATGEVAGFVDSDYAGDPNSRKPLIGYIFQFCGCTVSWKANLQPVVALSSTGGRKYSCHVAFKEALWLKGFQNWVSNRS